ncbi:MAG: hypothetical protein EBU73_00185 [Chitinophagia bacterium]|nr:hypothetical protein [Chitinophagia bacterium]
MKILVVAATSLELDFISDIQTSEKNQVIKKVLGVGQVPTTYHLLNHIESLTPDLIVQIGIAGSFVNDCTLGEVFAIGEEYMSDMGVVETGTFQSIFDLKLMDENQFNPVLESMEGAAFHYCCIMKNIPFIQIRGVSNYVGERNKSKWQIEASLEAVAKSTQEFISNI